MEGVVVSRQILLSNLLLRRRLVFETIVGFNWFKSMPAAFHDQQARNGVRTNSVSKQYWAYHIWLERFV
jgi:hypothetical protein